MTISVLVDVAFARTRVERQSTDTENPDSKFIHGLKESTSVCALQYEFN